MKLGLCLTFGCNLPDYLFRLTVSEKILQYESIWLLILYYP